MILIGRGLDLGREAKGKMEEAIVETKEARAEDVEVKSGPKPKPKMICGAEWEGRRSGVLVGRSGAEPKKKDLCSFEGAKPERKLRCGSREADEGRRDGNRKAAAKGGSPAPFR